MMSQVIVLCNHYRAELEKLDLTTRYDDLEVVFHPGRCGMVPADWNELRGSLGENMDEKTLHVISGGCIANLPEKDQKVFQHYNYKLSQCLHMIISPALADFYVKQGYYLVTPGWLQEWPEILDGWGFDQETAQMFFKDTACSVLLLDTGVDPSARANLNEFSSYINLPAETLTIGLDHLELLLNNTVMKSRIDQDNNSERKVAANNNKDLAEFVMALDLLNSLARVRTEQEVIESIKDMFTMLFGPGEVVIKEADDRLFQSGELVKRIDDDSFSFNIIGTSGMMGSVEVKNLRFPEHREHYIALAAKIVNICALAIENARHYQQIKDISDTDGLTGIGNRRKLEDHLEIEWRRMQRSKSPLAVLMCDIDYFKDYNDLYGHLAGDDCLKEVARVLAEHCRRPGDLAARFGGEEFTLVFPVTDLQGAVQLAESIRQAVEDLQLVHEKSTVSKFVTISIGVATMVPSKDGSHDDLLHRADKLLFEAKSAGRNRIAY